MTADLRRIVLIVAVLNLAYFGVEFAVAVKIESLSLFADSADFLEDAAVNLLIFMAMRWSAARRALVGRMLAVILVLPALAFLVTLWFKVHDPLTPDPVALSTTGLGALAVNLVCAGLLAAYRNTQGSLSRAAFLSARNDAAANLAIIIAGLVSAYLWRAVWPDVIAGIGIAILNLGAAREVWEAAHHEATPHA